LLVLLFVGLNEHSEMHTLMNICWISSCLAPKWLLFLCNKCCSKKKKKEKKGRRKKNIKKKKKKGGKQ